MRDVARHLIIQNQICHQEFNAKVSLKVHIRRIHEEIRYECEVCGKTFTDPKTVRSHQKIIHEGQKSGQSVFL